MREDRESGILEVNWFPARLLHRQVGRNNSRKPDQRVPPLPLPLNAHLRCGRKRPDVLGIKSNLLNMPVNALKESW